MKVCNWGIIGLGHIALQFASAFQHVANASLLSVASRDKHQLALFKEKFDVSQAHCYTNYEDLINCEAVDIIYIALPHSLHFEWIMTCIERHKNVLVEKPATISSEQMNVVNDLLERKNVFFAEGFMYRYHPQTKAIIDMIRSNELGELISMKSFFGQAIMKKKRLFGFNRTTFNKKNRLFNKKLAGGAVLDLGCYPITMTTLVAGLNHRIDYDNIALKHRELEYVSTGVDVDAYATLCFADGFTSLVGCSFKKSLGQATTIVGSKGELTIEHSWHCSPSTITMKGKKINLGFNQYDNIFCYEIESISQSVIQGECMPNFPAVNRHDTVHHMNLIDRWLCDDKE